MNIDIGLKLKELRILKGLTRESWLTVPSCPRDLSLSWNGT